VDWDAFLLGDYHHFEREDVEGVLATYSGSTERASAEERESRGYNVLEFDGDVGLSRRSLDHVNRTWVYVDVDLSATEGDATSFVVERALEHDVEDAVVVVYVDGPPEVEVGQADVETAVASEGALLARVIDRRDSVETEGEEVEVAFADPDEAVRERVEEMDVSGLAREIDVLVRGDGLPDSRLADEMEELVSERVAGGWTPDASEDDGATDDGDSGGAEADDGETRNEEHADEETEVEETGDGETRDEETEDGETEEREAGEREPGDEPADDEDGAPGERQSSVEDWL
ncbi:MAG: DNA double-strand break repair protein Mre11, partial [Halobacteriales archaeon]